MTRGKSVHGGIERKRDRWLADTVIRGPIRLGEIHWQEAEGNEGEQWTCAWQQQKRMTYFRSPTASASCDMFHSAGQDYR